MEKNLFNNVYKDKVVLLTGHTGFKGSWLAMWLLNLGAKVVGYSKDIPTDPSHFEILELKDKCTSIIGNINNEEQLLGVFQKYQPEFVFHLAAQSVVGYSYERPLETFESNVMGTLKVFECARKTKSVRIIVNVTSDKCYQNDEQNLAFKEQAAMGGNDPYSCSKGAAELLTNCYRTSFFSKENILVASARAGNVIAGGDWTHDALIPDLIKAQMVHEKMGIRSPYATRPWQFVLEPLSGYLLLGQKLFEEGRQFAEGWNFGPDNEKTINVLEILKLSKSHWSILDYTYNKNEQFYKEAKYLKLDSSKAENAMGWKSIWPIQTAVKKTIEWYKSYHEQKIIKSENHLQEYIEDANKLGLEWAR